MEHLGLWHTIGVPEWFISNCCIHSSFPSVFYLICIKKKKEQLIQYCWFSKLFSWFKRFTYKKVHTVWFNLHTVMFLYTNEKISVNYKSVTNSGKCHFVIRAYYNMQVLIEITLYTVKCSDSKYLLWWVFMIYSLI